MPKIRITTAALAEGLAALTEAVQAMQNKIDLLQESLEERPMAAASVETATAVSPTPIEQAYPIPMEYREVVDNILNKSFGIEVTPLSDRPAFMFTIIVPATYSNMSAPYREMYKIDKRPKVVSYAEGTSGVRDWAERVYNNFDQDTRTRITMERVAVV